MSLPTPARRPRWTNWPAFNRWYRELPTTPAWARQPCTCTDTRACLACEDWADLFLEIQARQHVRQEADGAD